MNWFRTVRTRHFYFKVIVVALLLCLLPVLASSLVYYQNAKTTIQEELREANGNYLNQTANAMELMIDQIGSSFRQLTLEGATMRQFELFPRGSYYETLSGELRDEDLPMLESYLRGKKQALNNMRALKLSNDFIHSVYYFDSGKRLIMTSDLLVYEPDGFYDEGWNRFPQGDPALPMILDMRSAKTPDGTSLNVIPLVYKTSIEGNVLVINLDADRIYESFVRKPVHIGGNRIGDRPFIVLSSRGTPMLYDDANPVNREIGGSPMWQRPELEPQGSLEAEAGGERLFVTWVRSETLGWTFVFATPLTELYKSVAGVRNTILWYCFVLAAAGCLLALLLARHLYAPIRRVLQFIKSADDRYGGSPKGEWHVIRRSLEDAFEDRWSLRHRLKESLPAYKDTFVRSLLRQHSYDRAYIEERLHYLGFDIDWEHLTLMVLAWERSPESPADAESESLAKVHLADTVAEVLPDRWKRMMAETTDDALVVIVNVDAQDLSALFAAAERLIGTLDERLAIGCSIGIGRHCLNAGELGRAYEEALEALRYRGIVGSGQVIYIEDVLLDGTAVFRYPSDKEESLNTYIVNGDAEQALRLLDQIVKELGGEKGRVHVRQIQYALMRLLGSLVATSERMNLDLAVIAGEKRSLYAALLHKDDLHDAVQWLRGLVQGLASGFGTAFREKNNRYVEQAMSIIHGELERPLSLVELADRLQLSPSYLSRIFKEHCGYSFSDYLTQVRMEKGKALLLETDLKIKEIGERVGYLKSDYFIKLFRECIGMTPGEYRKARSEL